MITDFMSIYTHPEKYKASYIFDGQIRPIKRKAALTELMADICDTVYSLTPVISNEAVNRDVITNIASNSRNKLVAALLRNQLEVNLGLSGTGQEVSIMRSTLIRTGILVDRNGMPEIELRPENEHIANMLESIETEGGFCLENLKTVSALVKNILEHDHKARNTDNHLYLMVLEHYSGLRGIDIHAMTVPVFLKELDRRSFPGFETVRRSRQKVQAAVLCNQLW